MKIRIKESTHGVSAIEEKAKSWRDAKSLLTAAEEAYEEAKEALLEAVERSPFEGYGVKITEHQNKGSIDYKKIPELVGVNLEKYRGPASERYFKIVPSVEY